MKRSSEIIRPPVSHEEHQRYDSGVRFRKLSITQKSSDTMSAVFDDPAGFSEGDAVEHERFGNGKIISIDGQAPNTTATVEFQNNGRKKLLLRFAKLRKI